MPRRGAVLVVHPDEAVRRSFAGVLSQRGYTMLEALDRDDALEVINAHAPSVLIVARQLPSGSYRSLLDAVGETPTILLDEPDSRNGTRRAGDSRVVAVLAPLWQLSHLCRAIQAATAAPPQRGDRRRARAVSGGL